MKTLSDTHPAIESLTRAIIDGLEAIDAIPQEINHSYPAALAEAPEGSRILYDGSWVAPGLRRAHVEQSRLGKIDVLHTVLFPEPGYDVPIYGLDIVAVGPRVNLAVVDLSPQRLDHSLPPKWEAALGECVRPELSNSMARPAWGDIFSDHCVIARLAPDETEAFVSYARSLLTVHLGLLSQEAPMDEGTEGRRAAQKHYCEQFRLNTKTSGLLAAHFGEAWTRRFVDEVLFDIRDI